MYAIYHGPNGLREIANRVHRSTLVLAEALRRLGHTVNQGPFFDTIKVRLGRRLGGGGGDFLSMQLRFMGRGTRSEV